VPELIFPGVYVEEVSLDTTAIEGVPTSTAAFVGATAEGPTEGPLLICGLAEFERTYGDGRPLTFADDDAPADNFLWHAARAFFANGGARLYVQRVVGADDRRPVASDYESALKRLEHTPEIAVVAAPGASIAEVLVDHAERMRYRFAVLDPEPGQTVDEVSALRERLDSSYGALYYPWVRAPDPVANSEIDLPPSGYVAGIFARTDTSRGVFRAPANEPLESALGLETTLSDDDAERLNSRGINPLRHFQDGEVRVWGARTVSSDPEWKYVNVRRYFVYLEHSIDRGTQWTVFEPNDEALWANVRASISDFFLNEFRAGALAGDRPDDAFFVKCDRSTMTQEDLDNGRLICLVGVAPIRPAEFVIIRIGRWTSDHDDDD
jgi:Bacteriophage tail sheath protein